MRPIKIMLLGASLSVSTAFAQTEIPLYAEMARSGEEVVVERGTPQKPNRSIRRIAAPSILAYLPGKNPTGSAVILCSGGGYGSQAIDFAIDLARWLQTRGVAGLVLKYRFPDAKTMGNGEPLPLQDARRALQLTRANAEKWDLRAERVGIMGFSAGGHLAALAATQLEAAHKPNFLILFAPVISMQDGMTNQGTRQALLGTAPDSALKDRFSNELHVSAQTPPTFIAHAQNDLAAPLAASELFVAELRKAGVAATLFSPREGGHAIAIDAGGDVVALPENLEKWLVERELMIAQPKPAPK